ncbi:phosphate ABC transporter permease PstA [Desulfofundulus thermosubterraneus]|uniref:Phosphate transport system permease protein PstA n=1 Tax=Desulfofundulus thermosubterraneus DSM 16057 TaxID=1121432 RepID=A0A1M6BJJ4_9FIRM|nr:phosphate ABC transporter permease PstA [Desulfofundulus thermosubterraneus]SHI48653.1 phosphate ABC transporter membrane protein 2, PhoT family [Desulfofundulus thermosubterraneus DSM 16057]
MNARLADRLATIMFWMGAAAVLAILALLLGYILWHGIRVIDWRFLTTPPQTIIAGGGVGPQIFNSFYLLLLTMLISAPLGLLAGIYLAEYASRGRVTEYIRLSIEALTSLPSIVVGLFGLLIFVNMTGWGYSLMSGALALTVINLPLMVRISEESIRSVPSELREASLALGATRWETMWRVILPSALPGLVTGAIIAAGRVFGEAAALLYTAGMSSPILNFSDLNPWSPTSPLNPFRPAETLAVHIWKINSEALIPDVRRVADGSAAVLILVVLLFNICARWLGRRIYRRLTAT